MRKILAAFVISFASLFAIAPSPALAGGDSVFPLDFPLPFPWDTIEGLWMVEGDNELNAYYSFELVKDCEGRQLLQVMQLDPASRQVVAEGVGYKMNSGLQVWVAMEGPAGTYMMRIGAYRTKGLNPKTVTGVRIFPFKSPGNEQRYRIHKVEEQPMQKPYDAAFSTLCN